MQVRLQISNGKANVKQVVLRTDTIIGRSPDCQLKIASSQVSRKHCQISIKEKRVSIRDLGSANGTFVNGQPLAKNQDLELASGSAVVIGPLKFVVLIDPVNAPKSTKSPAKKSAPKKSTPASGSAIISATAAPPASQPPEVFAPAVDVEEPEIDVEDEQEPSVEPEQESVDVDLGFDDVSPQEETLPATAPVLGDFGVADEAEVEEQRAEEAARQAEPPPKRRSLFDFFRKKSSAPADEVSIDEETDGTDEEVEGEPADEDVDLSIDVDVEMPSTAPDEETVSFTPDELDDSPDLGFPDDDTGEVAVGEDVEDTAGEDDEVPELPTDEESVDEDDDLGNFLGQFN